MKSSPFQTRKMLSLPGSCRGWARFTEGELTLPEDIWRLPEDIWRLGGGRMFNPPELTSTLVGKVWNFWDTGSLTGSLQQTELRGQNLLDNFSRKLFTDGFLKTFSDSCSTTFSDNCSPSFLTTFCNFSSNFSQLVRTTFKNFSDNIASTV